MENISCRLNLTTSSKKIRYFLFLIPVEGWTSVMVSMFLLAGMLFVNLGFLGLYIGKIFNEAKGRPLYLVKEYINIQESNDKSV